MSNDKAAQDAIESADEGKTGPGQIPAAGPHAKPSLTDNSKTPGAGTLPDNDQQSIDPGAG